MFLRQHQIAISNVEYNDILTVPKLNLESAKELTLR